MYPNTVSKETCCSQRSTLPLRKQCVVPLSLACAMGSPLTRSPWTTWGFSVFPQVSCACRRLSKIDGCECARGATIRGVAAHRRCDGGVALTEFLQGQVCLQSANTERGDSCRSTAALESSFLFLSLLCSVSKGYFFCSLSLS